MAQIERLSINISFFSQPAECRVELYLIKFVSVKLTLIYWHFHITCFAVLAAHEVALCAIELTVAAKLRHGAIAITIINYFIPLPSNS